MLSVVVVIVMLSVVVVIVMLSVVVVIVMLIVVVVIIVIIVIIKGYWDNALCRHNHRAAEGRGFGKTF
jgi:hypothetical protein